MKKIELLLPAGNWDCLKAAVENGADAVYFGVGMFNARRRADNFSYEDLSEVVSYCHENGVRVYITMNILVKNNELDDFFESVKQIYLAGADAVIIQEISFLPIIKENFPDLEVHVSTQAAVANTYHSELVNHADKLILPREMTKREIETFVEKAGVPIEIFVQGALCFCFSGRCLFSSVIGGRSGNRGLCAQPCRRKYNQSYLLSMKDLSLINKIPEIIELGVVSVKIEGRLRSPKYVAAAAKVYRTAIDSYYNKDFKVDKGLFEEMKLAFNREFTEGYFVDEQELVSPDKSMSRGLLLGEMQEDNMIKLKEDLSVGDGLGIWLSDRVDGAVVRRMELNDKNVIRAKKGDLVKIHIRANAGTKIYKTSSVKKGKEIKFEKNAEINIEKRVVANIKLPKIEEKESKEELLVKVYSVEDAEQALVQKADKVFYNIFSEDYNNKFGAYIPRILNDADVDKAVELIKKHEIKDILIGDLGVYVKLKENKNLNIYLDYSSNVFNDIDLQFFNNTTPIISPELSYRELLKFKNKNFSVLVHGKLILMNTKYQCLPNQMKDKKGYTFPVRKEHNYWQVLNSRTLAINDDILKLKENGINKFFLDLDEKVKDTVQVYKLILSGKNMTPTKKGMTKGHWEEGVE